MSSDNTQQNEDFIISSKDLESFFNFADELVKDLENLYKGSTVIRGDNHE